MNVIAWLLIVLAGVVIGAGLIGYGRHRASAPAPTRSGRDRRRVAAGFPPDPSITAAAALRREQLKTLYALPFDAAAGEPATVAGPDHARVVSNAVEALR